MYGIYIAFYFATSSLILSNVAIFSASVFAPIISLKKPPDSADRIKLPLFFEAEAPAPILIVQRLYGFKYSVVPRLFNVR